MLSTLFQTANERLSLLILVYIFYLFFGALVFDAFESPHEARVIRNLNEFVRQFRQRHNQCLTDDELNAFIKVVSIANDHGVPAVRNVSKEPNWSFGQAVFFSGTVLTTIGYGDVYPQTPLGKLFCMVFAIVGIPATMVLLYAIIERLMCVTNVALEFYIDKLQPILSNVSKQVLQRSHMHVLFSFTCALIVFILFFLIPAGIYAHIENWSYLNAFYYCFISLSTVGLGDYVPGDNEDQAHRHLYKICSILYLIVGVMVMVWLLEIFSQTPEFNFYRYFTLSKDGILTHHQDTIHTASSAISAGSRSLFSANDSVNYEHQLNESQNNSTSGVGAGNQYDPIRNADSSGNDAELILKRSGNSSNYLSLSDVNRE
jgi:potassium channel subfamily K protein 1